MDLIVSITFKVFNDYDEPVKTRDPISICCATASAHSAHPNRHPRSCLPSMPCWRRVQFSSDSWMRRLDSSRPGRGRGRNEDAVKFWRMRQLCADARAAQNEAGGTLAGPAGCPAHSPGLPVTVACYYPSRRSPRRCMSIKFAPLNCWQTQPAGTRSLSASRYISAAFHGSYPGAMVLMFLRALERNCVADARLAALLNRAAQPRARHPGSEQIQSSTGIRSH